jgi:hypothetical protein
MKSVQELDIFSQKPPLFRRQTSIFMRTGEQIPDGGAEAALLS